MANRKQELQQAKQILEKLLPPSMFMDISPLEDTTTQLKHMGSSKNQTEEDREYTGRDLI